MSKKKPRTTERAAFRETHSAFREAYTDDILKPASLDHDFDAQSTAYVQHRIVVCMSNY